MQPVANNDADWPMDNWLAGRLKSPKPAMTKLCWNGNIFIIDYFIEQWLTKCYNDMINGVCKISKIKNDYWQSINSMAYTMNARASKLSHCSTRKSYWKWIMNVFFYSQIVSQWHCQWTLACSACFIHFNGIVVCIYIAVDCMPSHI